MRKNPSLLGYIWQHSDQWVECVLAETGTTIIDRTRARSLIGIFIECIASWSEPRDFPTTAGLQELLIQTIPATLAPHPSLRPPSGLCSQRPPLKIFKKSCSPRKSSGRSARRHAFPSNQ